MKKDKKMISNMEKYGGSFIRALGELCDRATDKDYRKLSNVFCDEFEEFSSDKWRGVKGPEERV